MNEAPTAQQENAASDWMGAPNLHCDRAAKGSKKISTTHTKIIFQSDAAPRVSFFTVLRIFYFDLWVVINKVGNRHENRQRDDTIWRAELGRKMDIMGGSQQQAEPFPTNDFLKKLCLSGTFSLPHCIRHSRHHFYPQMRCGSLSQPCLTNVISKFKQIWPNFYMCPYMHFYTGCCNPNLTISLQHKDTFYL